MLTRFLQVRVVHLGKRLNTHSMHFFEPKSLQAFLATIVICGDIIVTADIEVKTLQSRKRPQRTLRTITR